MSTMCLIWELQDWLNVIFDRVTKNWIKAKCPQFVLLLFSFAQLKPPMINWYTNIVIWLYTYLKNHTLTNCLSAYAKRNFINYFMQLWEDFALAEFTGSQHWGTPRYHFAESTCRKIVSLDFEKLGIGSWVLPYFSHAPCILPAVAQQSAKCIFSIGPAHHSAV